MNVNTNRSHPIARSLALLMLLIGACTQQVPVKLTPGSDQRQAQSAQADTAFRLKFTTAVRSILEDRHGNIWFGSHQEGVCRFDGERMTYFTEADGLTTTHIWQIYAARNGERWLAMEDGRVCRFNGVSFDVLF